MCLKHMGTVLTVFARVVGGTHVPVPVVLVALYFFDDLVEEIIKKLVGVLVHGAAEEFVAIAELVDEGTGRYGTLVRGILRNIYVEGAERGEESGRCGGDDGSGGSGSRRKIGDGLSGFATRAGRCWGRWVGGS